VEKNSGYVRLELDEHEHRLTGQTLRHRHEGGAEPHGYYEHPEDGARSPEGKIPTHVVVNTRTGEVWSEDVEGNPLTTYEVAREWAGLVNYAMKPGHQTFKVFRLVEEQTVSIRDGAITAWLRENLYMPWVIAIKLTAIRRGWRRWPVPKELRGRKGK
jgi:hypothetical protein